MLERENDDGETDSIPMLKTFTVFNVEQIDGLPLSEEAVCSLETFEPLPRTEALFRNSGTTIIEKGQNAFLHRQLTKSAYRNGIFLPTRPISTPPACMS